MNYQKGIPHYLIALDFDGTAFDTLASNANAMSVEQAYGLAITDIFGIDVYKNFKVEGLRNRAPSEVIQEIYQQGDRNLLDATMQDYYLRQGSQLVNLVPRQKGVALDSTNIAGEKTATELLVQGKLHYLLNNIGKPYGIDGQIWPKPTIGFIDFWNTIQNLKQQKEFYIETAIISSGHDRFIQNVFDTYALTYPDIMVTDDDMRAHTSPSEARLLVKPRPLPLVAAYKEWVQRTNQDFTPQASDGFLSTRLYTPFEARERIIYFGDDPNKDGGLAASGAVPFGLYNPLISYGREYRDGLFGDWRVISDIFLSSTRDLSEGKSLRQIFLNGTAYELKYPVREQLSLRNGTERR